MQYTLIDTMNKSLGLLNFVDSLLPYIDSREDVTDSVYEGIQLKTITLRSYVETLIYINDYIDYSPSALDLNICNTYEVYKDTLESNRDINNALKGDDEEEEVDIEKVIKNKPLPTIEIDALKVSNQMIALVYTQLLSLKIKEQTLWNLVRNFVDYSFNTLDKDFRANPTTTEYEKSVKAYINERVIYNKLGVVNEFTIKDFKILLNVLNIMRKNKETIAKVDSLIKYLAKVSIEKSIIEDSGSNSSPRKLNYDYLSQIY